MYFSDVHALKMKYISVFEIKNVFCILFFDFFDQNTVLNFTLK